MVAQFLNIGVDVQAGWPDRRLDVTFDGYSLTLLPRTRENSASVHIDLQKSGLSDEEAMTVISRFLSVIAWEDDRCAVMHEFGLSGTPTISPVPKKDIRGLTAPYWVHSDHSPKKPQARRALALHREALNAEYSELIVYAVLGYYKVIELKYKQSAARDWIRDNLSCVSGSIEMGETLERLDVARGNMQRHDYLYETCRTAAAHADPKRVDPIDPDDLNQIRGLYDAGRILRSLARHFIKAELGYGDSKYVQPY